VGGAGANFFKVLSVKPELGHAFDALRWDDGASPFVVSQDFFHRQLHGDANAIGREFEIDGETVRLAGVLPRDFSFLGMPISAWVLRTNEAPPPKDRWWLGLRGTVGLLHPNVTPAAAEVELRKILEQAGVARRGSKVHATFLSAAVYRALWAYGGLFGLVCLGVLGAGAIAAYRGGRPSKRFWAYFVAKTLLPVLAAFLFVFELMGVNRLGATGIVWWGRELFAMWVLFCAVAITLWWSWRDQKLRCRQCATRMRQPVRIGVPGQMLLDPAGEEVICPRGHGSVYTSESVLGSELSDRWVGLEEETR
jgi:hypothetical protein